jgi:hypothetical protein
VETEESRRRVGWAGCSSRQEFILEWMFFGNGSVAEDKNVREFRPSRHYRLTKLLLLNGSTPFASVGDRGQNPIPQRCQ